MSKALDELNQLTAEFEATAKGDETNLRLDLAEIIWRGLARNGWTQRRLARESGLPDALISNLIHGNRNWTCATAAQVVHALGVSVNLREASAQTVVGTEPKLIFHSVQGHISEYQPKGTSSDKGFEIRRQEATSVG